jgi:hypothetical protein
MGRPTRACSQREAAVSLSLCSVVSGGCLPWLTLGVSHRRHPMSDSHSDWRERLDRLRRRTAEEFRGCPNAPLQQLQVCARYFNDGYQEDFDHGALIDFLGVSTPSVPSMAGYPDSAALRVMELPPLLIHDADGTCRAPTLLPPPPPMVVPPVQTEIEFSEGHERKKNDA